MPMFQSYNPVGDPNFDLALAAKLSLRPTAKGPVASRNGIANTTITTNKAMQDRCLHFATEDIYKVSAIFLNGYVDGVAPGGQTYTEASAGTTARRVGIEYPIGGGFVQLPFAGSVEGTGAAGALMETDMVTLPTPIRKGDPFFSRNLQVGSSNSYFMQGSATFQFKTMPGEGWEAAASSLTDKTMGGTIAQANQFRSPPIGIIGMTQNETILMYHNSRGRAIGDTVDGRGLVGTIERSLDGMGIINASISGDAFVKFNASHSMRLLLAPYASRIIGMDCINDTQREARTAAQVLADMATFAGYFPSKPVYFPLAQPYTNSTDTWATLANQTVLPNESVRQAVNTSLRSFGVTGMKGFLDTTSAVEDSATGKWLPSYDGSACTDGLHESRAGALRTVAQRLITPRVMGG